MLRTKWMVGVLGGLVATAAIVASHVVWAGGPEAGKCADGPMGGKWADCPFVKLIHGHIGRLMVLQSEIDVTKEQKGKIKEILKSEKPEIVKVFKGVWEKKRALHDAVLAEKPDEQAIRKAADDLGKSIGDTAVLASKIVGEVRPVLTAEQRSLIQKCRGECEEATSKFFDKMMATP